MKQLWNIVCLLALSLSSVACGSAQTGDTTKKIASADTTQRTMKTEDEWQHCLTPQQYHVLRQKGTERAFSGDLWDNHDTGRYVCAGCGQPLFTSNTKFDSGTGWPSFWQPAADTAVVTETDKSHGMVRTEVMCSNCGGHLGHVFNDGPQPTNQRYCINSVSLKFIKE